MKAYQVQFVLPVDNPEQNVRITRTKKVVHFEVPVNLPNLGHAGYYELSAMADVTSKLDLSTGLNTDKIDKKESTVLTFPGENTTALRHGKRDRKRGGTGGDSVGDENKSSSGELAS